MFRAVAVTALVAWALTASAPCLGQQERDYTWFLGKLYDLDALTRVEPGQRCAQASSYDRASKYDAEKDQYVNWGANGDAGQYISVDPNTNEALMADLKGPGCIFRIWSANPQGKIRFYLDGDTKPTYEFDFAKMFKGEIDPFLPPLVWNRAKMMEGLDQGGNPASDCFLPIPYAKSCRVTADRAHGQYYHIGYQTYAPGTKVKSFHLPLTAAERAALDKVREKWTNCGVDPQPAGDAKTIKKSVSVAAGKEAVLAELTGPATIRQFRAKLDNEKARLNRAVLLRFYWDGSSQPSVDAPLGEFFGESYGEPDYKSLPLGVIDGMGYCYWRMPFKKSARLVAVNQGEEPVTIDYEVATRSGPVAAEALYFHAKWRREKTSEHFDYPFVECTGKGNFVGDALFVDNVLGGWWGEGDEKSFVDGEKFPSMFGTGSEDYFGDAWGIRYFVNPTHGCPNSHDRIQCCYRWHIADCVPFTKSDKFTIENYAAFADTKNDYSSVAYWYQAEPSSDFFKPTTLADRAPLPPVIVRGVTEAETASRVVPMGAEVVEDMACSMGKALRIGGSSLRLPIQVPDAGKYTIEAYAGPGKPSPLGLFVNGNPVGDKVKLAAGINTLELRKPEEGPAQLDYLVITPWRNFIRDWIVIGPFPNPDAKTGLATDYGPEDRIDTSRTLKGKDGKDVKWRPARPNPEGVLDFVGIFPDHDDAVCYAATIVTSPDDRDETLLLGSDDGVRVWLNGKLVWDNPVQRGVVIDQDHIPVKLTKGENTLLIKVEQGGGGWGLAARFADPDEALTYSMPK
jgi:hypothetical protein